MWHELTQNSFSATITRRLVGWMVVRVSGHIIMGIDTSDSVHSCNLYGVAPEGEQASSTMTRYHTQSHYLEIELTSSYPILIMSSAWLGSERYQFYKSLRNRTPNLLISHTRGPRSTDSTTAPGSVNQTAPLPPYVFTKCLTTAVFYIYHNW